jgi:hypothetical protein
MTASIEPSPEPTSTYSTELVDGTLRVVNAALSKIQRGAVSGRLLSGGLERFDGLEIGLMLYKDEPDFPHDYFTLCLQEGWLCLAQRGRNEPDVSLRVPRSLLQQIIAEPSRYIGQPRRLPLDWLRHRLDSASVDEAV